MMCLLFAGESYYAKGGFNDFKGSFPSIAAAKEYMTNYAAERGPYFDGFEWWHIIDSETLDVLAQSKWQAYGCNDRSYCAEPEE